MRCDVVIMQFPQGLQSSDEIPADWNPEHTGTAAAAAMIDRFVHHAEPDGQRHE
jgi:hypothetical protein